MAPRTSTRVTQAKKAAAEKAMAPKSTTHKVTKRKATASKKSKPKAATAKSSSGRVSSEPPAVVAVAAPTTTGKRKRTATTEDRPGSAKQAARPVKRAKTSHAAKIKAEVAPAVINQRPTETVNVFVFGGGENGELGLGPKQTTALRPRKNPYLDPSVESGLQVVEIACGGMHTVALTADNKVVTWGVNDNEALGRNTQWDGGLRDVDDESAEEDGELNPLESTPTAIPSEHFGADTVLVSVAAGDSCSFALTSTGLVYGWGTFRDPEGKESFCYAADGKTVIKKQATPMLIPGLTGITQIACGANHALALDTAGSIWGWGCGQQAQFGRRLFGRHQDTLRPHELRFCRGKTRYLASGEYHCFAVDRADNVWGWGLNSFGEAGDATTAGTDAALLPQPVKIDALCGRKVVQLAGGAHHSAARTADGACLVWGRLDGGQLGVALSPAQLTDDRLVRRDERGKPRICLVPTTVAVGEEGTTVAYVACGTDHTLFVSEQGRGYATGFGSEGQLGLGTEDDADTAHEMGGKHVKDQTLIWAGAGGQFSVVAGKVTKSAPE